MFKFLKKKMHGNTTVRNVLLLEACVRLTTKEIKQKSAKNTLRKILDVGECANGKIPMKMNTVMTFPRWKKIKQNDKFEFFDTKSPIDRIRKIRDDESCTSIVIISDNFGFLIHFDPEDSSLFIFSASQIDGINKLDRGIFLLKFEKLKRAEQFLKAIINSKCSHGSAHITLLAWTCMAL